MQDVLFILENEEKRNDFILRLKQAGETSKEFQAILNSMSSLGVYKPPREVNQTTILRHAFQYCDGMEAFQNFRLVSKSWKIAVESTQFYGPRLYEILEQIVEKFGQGEYPKIYHKLLQNFKKNRSLLWLNRTLLSNSFKPIAKLVSQNMKGLRSISIGNDFDIIGDEIYEKFIIEFLPNSKNTLCELRVPKLFLPNVSFPNLTDLTVADLNISFDTFKTQFSQILKNVSDLKVFHIELFESTTPSILNYVISNYAEQCLVSYNKIAQFPVKIIYNSFDGLVDDCQFKSSLEYAHIFIDLEDPDETNWNNFKNNIYDFNKLKGIHFYDYNTFEGMQESDFYKPETNIYPHSFETFYSIWPNRIQFLKSHGIQILSKKEFDSKYKELSKKSKMGISLWVRNRSKI